MNFRLVVASLWLLGCSNVSSASTDAGPVPGTVVDAGGYTLTVLAPAPAGSCDVHASQAAHFTDTTAQWGVSSLANTGFYSADSDHDGYADLVVLGGAADAGLQEGVLMNRPAQGGGRTFVDATQQSGLFQPRDGSARLREADMMSFADVNNDGFIDVYSGVDFPAGTPTIPDRNEVLLNDGRGHFTLAPQSAPSTITESSGYQGVFTDVDDDGSLDLLLTYWYENSSTSEIGSQAQLFLGGGDGTFTSVTQSAGLMMNNTGSNQSLLGGTDSRPSFGAVACDVDGDGYPELLVSSYGGQSNVLWHNDGTGHFSRVVQQGGYDGDLIVDYHDNQYYTCYCTAHASDAYCTGAPKPLIECPQPVESYWSPGYSDSPALANGNNFSAACRDIDGDGKPDVFQGTIRHWWAGNATDPSQILLNKTPAGGAISFQRVDDAQSGIVFPHIDPGGWNEGIQQSTLVDMNNDGRTDILTGGSDYAYQYGHLFIQQPDGTFQDLAQAWGMMFPCVDGLAVVDLDRDGDLDVIVRGSTWRNCASPGWPALSGMDPGFAGYAGPEIHVFTSDASTHGSWLELRLVATDGATNRMGLGANVTVTANGVTQTQQLLGAHGIGSESDDPGVLFFGVGACSGIDTITVTWPNQTHSTQTWTNVPTGHLVELRQGDTTVYGVNL